jgi:hypothetical protein
MVFQSIAAPGSIAHQTRYFSLKSLRTVDRIDRILRGTGGNLRAPRTANRGRAQPGKSATDIDARGLASAAGSVVGALDEAGKNAAARNAVPCDDCRN